MPLTLVRRPRPGRVLHKVVADEVRAEMSKIGQEAIATLQADIATWQQQPEFRYRVTLGKEWKLTVRVNRRTKIGKIYKWVDEGTGERGNDPAGKAYDIVPKRMKGRKKKLLSFNVPYNALTMPKIKNYDVQKGSPAYIRTPHVHAPGIVARDFTEALRLELKDRDNPNGFQRRVYNAIRRGMRHIGKRR